MSRREAGSGQALAGARPPLRQALALGLLHGPTELLPVSSAGHTTLVPWLAGWSYAHLDGEQRKSFEVALHAGAAAALLSRPPGAGLRGYADGESAPMRRFLAAAGAPSFVAAAALPPAVAGYALGEAIERRLGTPRTIAAGLLAGALAIAWGEIGARRVGAARRAGQARLGDGLAVGLAQALALGPGVSRSGVAFAAARRRGFRARDADRLSWQAGLPVIAGATLLQGLRLRRRGAAPGARPAMAVGAAAAFASTLASVRVLGGRQRVAAMRPACLYRVALACLVFARARQSAPPGADWRRS